MISLVLDNSGMPVGWMGFEDEELVLSNVSIEPLSEFWGSFAGRSGSESL